MDTAIVMSHQRQDMMTWVSLQARLSSTVTKMVQKGTISPPYIAQKAKSRAQRIVESFVVVSKTGSPMSNFQQTCKVVEFHRWCRILQLGHNRYPSGNFLKSKVQTRLVDDNFTTATQEDGRIFINFWWKDDSLELFQAWKKGKFGEPTQDTPNTHKHRSRKNTNSSFFIIFYSITNFVHQINHSYVVWMTGVKTNWLSLMIFC